MADIVQRRSEEMLPELEQMRRIGLFEDNEIKAIIKKSMSHEYKLARRVKVKKDFLAYIQYKIHLLALVKKRRDHMNYYFKKDEIENAIVGRIHRLFKQCTFRWPEDLKLWMSHVEFCKERNKKIQLSKIWTALLQLHGNANINLWAMAAKWELEDNHSVDNARQMFLRGIRHHPNDPKLWQEYFRMELIHVLTTRQRLSLLKEEDQYDEDQDEDFLKGKAALIVYNNAIKSIPNISRHKCDFLDIALQFSFFTGDIINAIINDVTEQHSQDPHARSIIAKLHLHRALLNDGDLANAFTHKADVWTAEKKCWEDFESAVKEVDTSEMWSEYVSFLCDRIEANEFKTDIGEIEVLTSAKKTRRKDSYFDARLEKYLSTFEKAHKVKKLLDNSYIRHVDHLMKLENSDKAVEILQSSIKDTKSIILMLKLLEIFIKNWQFSANAADIMELVSTLCTSKLDKEQEEKFLNLWLSYAKNEGDEELVFKVINFAQKSNSGVSSRLQVEYLQWQSELHGAEAAFEKYKTKIGKFFCPTLELIKAVLRMVESSELLSDKIVIDCYEDAVDKFGRENPDLWLDYARHMLRTDAAKVGKVHWRAMRYLEPRFIESFVSGYTLLHANSLTDK